MQILFNNQNNKEYQAMLNSLLKDVFFDFQFWYDLDLWDENYESYSMFENGEIVSNICVFKLKYSAMESSTLPYRLELLLQKKSIEVEDCPFINGAYYRKV